MIDPQTEQLLSFPQAAGCLPSRPHICTLHRWRLNGTSGVRLETVRIGPFAPRDHNPVGQVLAEVHCGREVVSVPQGRRKRDLA